MKTKALKSIAILFTLFVIYLIFSPEEKTTPPQPAAIVVPPDTTTPPETNTPKSSYYIFSYYEGDSIHAECYLTDTTARAKAEAALIELGIHKDSIKWER